MGQFLLLLLVDAIPSHIDGSPGKGNQISDGSDEISLKAAKLCSPYIIAIKDWRQTATQLHMPVKVLEPYSRRWDGC